MKFKFFSFLFLVLGPLSLVPGPLFAEAGWDKGFYIKSSDGNFKMKVGGRLQTQSLVHRRIETRPERGVAATPNNFSNTFKIRRARLQTSGTIYEKVDWFSILHVGSPALVGGGFNTLFFAGATYNVIPAFRVSVGMIQLPFDRMSENSSAWYFGIEPPLTATQKDGVKGLTIARNSMSLPYDLGMRFDGDIGNHFAYAFGAGNGSGFNDINTNDALSYSAMVLIHALEAAPFSEPDFAFSENPKLTFNLGTGLEDDDVADPDLPATRLWAWTSAAGGAFRYRGFSLNSELYYRIIKLSATTVEDANNDRRLKDIGYYVNGGYFFLPKKLEAMLTAAQLFREGADNDSVELGGGLNWYIHENNVKAQLDYTYFIDYDEVPGLNNAVYHRFRLMFSMFM